MREHAGAARTIRTAVAADLVELRRVYRAASLSNAGDAPGLLDHPEYLVFAGDGIPTGQTRLMESAVDGTRTVLGFATLATGPDGELELDDLFVDPRFRRRGVARELIADALRSAKAGGYRRLAVIANPHATDFYSAVGFVGGDRVVTALGDGTRMYLDVG